MGGIDHEFVGLKTLALGQDLLRLLDFGLHGNGFYRRLVCDRFYHRL
jgi:hypothetical protein